MFALGILLSLIILGCLSACFSYFIDFCFNEGNIFDFYYKFIVDKFSESNPKLFKILGGCNVCFNFYLSTIIYIIYTLVLSFNWLFFLPYIFSSCFMSMLINFKIFNTDNK